MLVNIAVFGITGEVLVGPVQVPAQGGVAEVCHRLQASGSRRVVLLDGQQVLSEEHPLPGPTAALTAVFVQSISAEQRKEYHLQLLKGFWLLRGSSSLFHQKLARTLRWPVMP